MTCDSLTGAEGGPLGIPKFNCGLLIRSCQSLFPGWLTGVNWLRLVFHMFQGQTFVCQLSTSMLLERSVALCDCIIRTVTLVRYSWHNLRYIKNQPSPGMPLMPLLLSCSRGSCLFIIGGHRVHVCICALHVAQLHLNIYSPHALKRSMADERSRFNLKCVTFCITGTGDLILSPVGCWQHVPDPGVSKMLSSTWGVMIFSPWLISSLYLNSILIIFRHMFPSIPVLSQTQITLVWPQ